MGVISCPNDGQSEVDIGWPLALWNTPSGLQAVQALVQANRLHNQKYVCLRLFRDKPAVCKSVWTMRLPRIFGQFAELIVWPASLAYATLTVQA